MHDRIGPYEIRHEIGRGGMGVVYLAHDERLDRDVAIKALPEHLAQDPARLERFEREARTLATLSHPNIAGILGLEEQGGARYLVLEYVEGETLADRLDRGPLPVDEAIELAVQIAAGVEAAHEAGVVHRDLKPANIRVTPEGVAKVLDFGLARIEEGASSTGAGSLDSPTRTAPQPQHSPTIEGAILGTAAYMSPEQARGRRVDKRSDVWSFGVVLYEMLVGASPFHGETATDSIGAVLHKDIDLERLPSATPVAVRHVLRRCLERDKGRRYRDIGDARIELESPLPAAVEAGGMRGHRVAFALVGLLAIATAIATVGWVLESRRGADSIAGATPMPPERVVNLSIPLPAGMEIAGAIDIARDGSQVAFVGRDAQGEEHIYLRRLDEDVLRRVEGSRQGWGPFFSPDGSSLGFFARSTIWRVPTAGGSPTKLRDEKMLVGASWMDDDTILYSVGFDSGIRRMTSSGAALDPITSIEANGAYAHVWPQHVPGTDRVLFTAWGSGDDDQGGGAVVDLGSGAIRRLTDSASFTPPGRWSASGHLIFERWDDGLSAAPFDPTSDAPIRAGEVQPLLERIHHLGSTTRSNFALSDDGVLAYVPAAPQSQRLVRVLPDGSTETILEQAEVESYAVLGGNIAFSADGRQALVGGSGDIVVVDLVRGIPRRLTFDDHNDRHAVWSHDESHVYFQSNREERWKIWSVPIDGSAPPEVLIEREQNVGSPSVGPAGEIVFSTVGAETGADLWMRDPDGTLRRLTESRDDELQPAISPDGAFIAYAADPGGIFEIYVVPTTMSGLPVQVSRGGGSAPRWDRDGGGLMFRRDRTVQRIAMDRGRPVGDAATIFPAPNLTSGNSSYDVAPDGTSMLAIEIDADAIPDEIRIVTRFFDHIREVAGEGWSADDAR